MRGQFDRTVRPGRNSRFDFPAFSGDNIFFITFIITIGQFHPIMFPMQSVIKDSAAVWVLRLGGGAGPGVTGANTELREHGGDNRGVVK